MDTYDWGFGSWATACLGVVAAGTLLIGGCGSVTNKWQVSDGVRVGMVNKISKRGAFWQTYEGQMALEGMVSGENSVGANVWDFAVDNYWDKNKQEEITNTLRSCMENGQKVKVTYKEMMSTFPWRSGSDYLIQSVEPLNLTVGNRPSVDLEKTVESDLTTPTYGEKARVDIYFKGQHYQFDMNPVK